MITHPHESQLNEFIDGTLPPDERERIVSHLGSCLPCASAVRRIESLVERARALPREIAPPKDAWDEVRAAVRTTSASRQAPSFRRHRWILRAAAATLVLALGSTVWLLRDSNSASRAETVGTGVTPARLQEFAPVEARYVLAASELQQTLSERRQTLDPETIAIIESSLTTIDSAIAEARAALARDPGNPTISRLLASSYEQKVGLLRRASELQPRS